MTSLVNSITHLKINNSNPTETLLGVEGWGEKKKETLPNCYSDISIM